VTEISAVMARWIGRYSVILPLLAHSTSGREAVNTIEWDIQPERLRRSFDFFQKRYRYKELVANGRSR